MKYSAIHLLWLTGVQALTLPPAVTLSDDPLPSDYLTSYARDDIIPTDETVKVKINVLETGTAQVLPTLSDVEPHTTGIIVPDVDTSTKGLLLTSPIPSPTSLLQPVASPTKEKRESTPTAHQLAERADADIFAAPIATIAPPSSIIRRTDHPAPRLGVRKAGPIQTNKFYSNFFLGDQTGPTYTFPYSIAWSKGQGPAASWGIAISHTEPKQRVFGPVQYNKANSYYINPVGIQSMVLSAKELGKTTLLAIDQITPFSARIGLKKNSASAPSILFPLVQGMAYVTGQFSGATPMIQSAVYIRSMVRVAKNPKSNVVKYNFLLEDGTTWRVYGYNTQGDPLDLTVVNNGLAQSKKPFYGTIQIAKDPKTTGSEKILDDGAGIYATGVTLTGSTSGAVGTYTFKFAKTGHKTGNIYTYALPHHVASFNADTTKRVSTLKLQTTTKGVGTAILGSVWTMTESKLPTSMSFSPWDITRGGRIALSTAAKNAIKPIALSEISQDMNAQSNLDSMYFSGKALAKFAQIVYVINDMLGDKALAQAGLAKLKTAFAVFATNKQKFPLVYESAWGGVVSSATYTNRDPHADFGNTYYNDHHFHWGYHILAAAYIGYLDKAWAVQNKDYVNTLVRDFANPSSKDTFFPQHRSFDWYHGHSWAHGLFASLDGKNQESSSEDISAMYAVKMWGTVIGDTNMVARANLQLAVMTRSLQQYYLYTSDNTAQPASFIGNKVAGILFENKVDHTTFFDSNIEAIQGIHMIPVHAPTGLSRSKTFIKQEWDAYFSNGRIDKINNAWKGIAYANYAVIEPAKAWAFFSSSSFQPAWVDGGASRTWYMAYSAALGGL
ncbi:hypothetical protein ACHAQA_002282 [Verticillium albo-atrum]